MSVTEQGGDSTHRNGPWPGEGDEQHGRGDELTRDIGTAGSNGLEGLVPFRAGHLRYFVTVADEGQITRAARKLRLAQPALSQAIAQLELEVGFELFERHPRGVSLTPAGHEFYVRARCAVDADAEAEAAGQRLARVARGTVEFGFVGSPPGLDSPRAMELLGLRHPEIEIRYHELPFPSAPASAWLSEVDVASCHLPPADPKVSALVIRTEARVVLAPGHHRLAGRGELGVDEVLDETFIGMHPSVEPAWAGFWSLDDHRGGPPRGVTCDRAASAQEVLAALAVRDALTTAPASVAGMLMSGLGGVVAIPLHDAAPSIIALVGHADTRNPAAAAFLDVAREHAGRGPASRA